MNNNLPLVDFLSTDEANYVIGFIPNDDISKSEKESVTIPKDGQLGQFITTHLQMLGEIAYAQMGPIKTISHRGELTFDIVCVQGHWIVDAGSDHGKPIMWLKTIANAAQVAFVQKQL